MDAHIKNVVIAVNELDGLLNFPVVIDLLQSAELSNPVVHMRHIISKLQRIELLEGDGLFLFRAVFDVESLVTVENFMIGIEVRLGQFIFESLMQGTYRRFILRRQFQVLKNRVEAFDLLRVRTHQYGFNAFLLTAQQGLGQELKIFVERSLRQSFALQLF